MKSIFSNTNVFNMSDPQPAWLFDVMFLNSDSGSTDSQEFAELITKTLIPTSMNLPSHHTEYVTKKWFGSEKSFPVIRTYGGDCTMNFDLRSEISDNDGIYRIAQLNSLYRTDDHGRKRDYIVYHPELENYTLPDDTTLARVINSDLHRLKFTKIRVRLKNKTVAADKDEWGYSSTVYEYNNCIITEFGFNEDLDYGSESKLTCKLTFHYDIWHIYKGTGEEFSTDNQHNV